MAGGDVPGDALQRLRGVLAAGGIMAWEADPSTLRFLGPTPPIGSTLIGAPRTSGRTNGRRWGDQVHPDDRDTASAALARALAEGGDHQLEYRAASEGSVVWIRDAVRVDVDAEGRRRLAGVMVDVTALRRAEADLREQEDLYHQLVERASDILFRTDAVGNFTFVNRPAVVRFGYRDDELLGMHYLELIAPDQRAEVQGTLEEQFRDRTPTTHLEFAAVAKDGHVVWIEQNTQLIVDQGRVTGFQAIARDVTERRAAQDALRESERRYRLLADNALDLIGLYTRAGRLLYASPSHEQVLGVRADELEGATLFELIDRDDAEAVREAMHEVADGGQPRRMDIRTPSRRGPVVVLDALLSAVHDEAEARVLLVGRDVTARRAAEVDLRRERQHVSRLEAVDEIRTTFLHAVAHDLRSPLTSILGSTATLRSAGDRADATVRRALLRSVESSARRLERMLTDLLDLDRLDQGQVGAVRGSVDVDARLREILAEWTEAGGREVDLEADVGTASVDGVMLERIVLNLLSNAARHSPADGSVTLRAAWAPDEPSALLITVEDRGPGVPVAYRTEVFERFRRAPGAEGTAGMGIGLWLVATFAQLHGGEAWVEDRFGGGAAFKVLLRHARATPT